MTPGRSRRVSVATTTGKEYTQNMVEKKRSESTSTLGQGSLLRSKQLKWENLASENNGKLQEEKSRTPSLYRRKFSENEANKLNLPISEESPVATTVSSLSNGDKHKNIVNDKKDVPSLNTSKIARTNGIRTHTMSDESAKEKKTVALNTKTTTKTDDKSTTQQQQTNLTSSSNDKDARICTIPNRSTPMYTTTRKTSEEKPSLFEKKEKKIPPPVAPKNTRKSSNIAVLQSQLETNFENPVKSPVPSPALMRRDTMPKKQTKALGVATSSSAESVSSINKIKGRLYDVNNNNDNNNTNDSSKTDDSKPATKLRNSSSSPDKPNSSIVVTNSNNIKNSVKSSNIPMKTASSTENINKMKRANSWKTQSKSFDQPMTSRIESVSQKIERVRNFSKVNQEEHDETSKQKVFEKERTAPNPVMLTNSTIKVASSKPENHFLNTHEDKKTQNKTDSHSPVLSQNNLHTETGSRSGRPTHRDYVDEKSVNSHNYDTKETGKTLNHKIPQKQCVDVSEVDSNKTLDKKSPDRESSYDNANYTGVQHITNSVHVEKDLVDQCDQTEVPQQKNQSDIFSSDSVLHRRSKISYVNEKTNFDFETGLNTDNNKYTSNDINSDAILDDPVENNYAKYNKISERLRGNTWTTSDSEELIESSELSPEEKDKSVSSSSSTKYDEKDGQGRRRRLTKKRSKRSKTRPKIPLRNCQQSRSIDTSDGDFLESNYTSDDFSTSRSRELSSAADSTICESDLNDNYEDRLDVLITNKNTNISTVSNNKKTQSIKNNQKENIILEETIHSSTIAELSKNTKNFYDGNSMKSSSMTTITKPQQQQTLMSLSSSNMGGSRSEDEGAKLENLHKNKDERIGSLTSISNLPRSKVLKTFNPLGNTQMSSSFKKRALSAENQPYSSSYTDISRTHNNNSIRASPFSVPSSFGGHSDSEQEKKENLEKLRSTFPYAKFDMKKPFSLNNIPPPDEESKENEEVLKNLPELKPYYLSERLVRDNAMMQNESSGNKLMNNSQGSDNDIDLDISPADSPFTSPKTNRFRNNHIQQDNDFIAPPENFKDEYNTAISSPKKVRTRPPLTMSSTKPISINDNSTDVVIENDDYISPKALRRSSYLQATSPRKKMPYLENEETDQDKIFDYCSNIPRVPSPPTDMDNQEARVIKRPGLPKLSTSSMIKEEAVHREESLENHGKYSVNIFIFKAFLQCFIRLR